MLGICLSRILRLLSEIGKLQGWFVHVVRRMLTEILGRCSGTATMLMHVYEACIVVASSPKLTLLWPFCNHQ